MKSEREAWLDVESGRGEWTWRVDVENGREVWLDVERERGEWSVR